MKNISILTIIILGLLITLTTSCTDKEEYTAEVTVVNNSGATVTSLTINGTEANYSKSIDKIAFGEEQNIEIKWTGKSSALFGSVDNSFVHITTEYSIGTTIFSVANEKDAKIDSNGNYYTEKEITNNTKLKIEINENGYTITTNN